MRLIQQHVERLTVSKRTSIGGKAKPTNKAKRRSHKKYRGQGRP